MLVVTQRVNDQLVGPGAGPAPAPRLSQETLCHGAASSFSPRALGNWLIKLWKQSVFLVPRSPGSMLCPWPQVRETCTHVASPATRSRAPL